MNFTGREYRIKVNLILCSCKCDNWTKVKESKGISNERDHLYEPGTVLVKV